MEGDEKLKQKNNQKIWPKSVWASPRFSRNRNQNLFSEIKPQRPSKPSYSIARWSAVRNGRNEKIAKLKTTNLAN